MTSEMQPESSDMLAVARQQRDQALACALLALAVMTAVLLSNFGPESLEMERARTAVRQHRELQEQHREILRANEAVLRQNQVELERMRQALNPSSP